jgi:small subunit ribosomal protein S10
MATAAKKSSAKKRQAKPKGAAAAAEPKLRIRVRAYEHKILDLSVKQIMDTANRFDAKIVGPVPLPTEIKRWTVNRSTFVHKDAREQFEMRIHKRLIDILSPNREGHRGSHEPQPSVRCHHRREDGHQLQLTKSGASI